MRVSEIFSSIHGECNGHHQGRIVTFIRLSGCNLQCYYCDSKHTQKIDSGDCLSFLRILEVVGDIENKHVCITGGEPLLHPDTKRLLVNLWLNGYHVSVETNGTIDISPYFRFVESFVVDYKGPSTGYTERMLEDNFINLRPSDVIKFVIANQEDFAAAIRFKDSIEGETEAVFAFSPVAELMTGQQLAQMMLDSGVQNAVLSLQIHKLLDLK